MKMYSKIKMPVNFSEKSLCTALSDAGQKPFQNWLKAYSTKNWH